MDTLSPISTPGQTQSLCDAQGTLLGGIASDVGSLILLSFILKKMTLHDADSDRSWTEDHCLIFVAKYYALQE